MWRGILQSFTVAWLSLKVFQRGGRKQHKHVYSCFLLLVAEWPWYSIKQWLTLTTHNTNRHCRARFYTFVGQPLSKQLYNWTLICDQNQNICESKVNAKTRIKVLSLHDPHSLHGLRFGWPLIAFLLFRASPQLNSWKRLGRRQKGTGKGELSARSNHFDPYSQK